MKKYLILCNLFMINLFLSQVSFKVINLQSIDHNKYLLKINIINESSEKLAIPFDINWFKGYFLPQLCPTFEEIEYPYLAPTVLVKNLNKQKYILAKSANIGYIGESLIKIDHNYQEDQKKVINSWMQKEDIKDYSIGRTNFYIMNNMLLIQPKECFSYEIILDISQIKYSKVSALYDEYILKKGVTYEISLIFCIDENIYHYLTSSQIMKFKEYKLFTGKIESNRFRIKY